MMRCGFGICEQRLLHLLSEHSSTQDLTLDRACCGGAFDFERVIYLYLFLESCMTMSLKLRLATWGGKGSLMLLDSCQVQNVKTDGRKEWMCTSIFSKWEVTLTVSVDMGALTETLSLVVKDAETKEEGHKGVLLDEISKLAHSGIHFD